MLEVDDPREDLRCGTGADDETARRAVQRPGQPFLLHAGGRGQGRQEPADANRASDAGTGNPDDCGVHAGSAGTLGAELRDLAESAAAGAAVGGIITLEEANRFLRERYIGEFNEKFSVTAQERGTAFRPCSRRDLDFVFSVQSERVVDQDNTVAIGGRWWQIDRSRWRYSLAKQRVTIHQHLDGAVSIRFGPHVVGRYDAAGQALAPKTHAKRR